MYRHGDREGLQRSAQTCEGSVIGFKAKPGAWVVTDRSGYIVDVTDAGARLFGLTPRDLMSRELSAFFERPLRTDPLDRLLPGSSLSSAVAIQRNDGAIVRTTVEITHVEEWERGTFRWEFS